MTTAITASELKNLLHDTADIHLLDVRRKADYQQSPATIKGATWLDPEQVGRWAQTLPSDRLVVVYCVRGGSVSQSVARALEESHPGVRYLEGGIAGWQDEGE